MVIVILDFSTSAADRDAALAQLDTETGQVRAMTGNLSYRAFASRHDETAVTLVQEWESEVAFTEYQRSESFTRSGEVIRPLMTAPPVSRRFHASPL